MTDEVLEISKAMRRLLAPLRRAVLKAAAPDPLLCTLTDSQQELLRTLEELEPITTKHLAHELALARPTVSNTVRTLVDADLVVRERSQQDQREVLLRLSPKARVLLEDAGNGRLIAMRDVVSELSEVELLTLRAAIPALEKILELLQEKGDAIH